METEIITDMLTKRSRYSDNRFQEIYEAAEIFFDRCASENLFPSEWGDCDQCPVTLKCKRFNDKVLAALESRNPHHNEPEIKTRIQELHQMKHGKYQLRLKGV